MWDHDPRTVCARSPALTLSGTFLNGGCLPASKGDAKPRKMPGFLASGGEEFNPGPETKLDRSELLCNKVLLKYKRKLLT